MTKNNRTLYNSIFGEEIFWLEMSLPEPPAYKSEQIQMGGRRGENNFTVNQV